MSIGPDNQEEQIGFSPVQQTRMVVAKASRNFFVDPIYYVFLLGLVGVIIGLLFNIHFPVALYVILSVLAIAIIVRFFYLERHPKK